MGAGTGYGGRVHGPDAPGRGLRCNPAKRLIDPYAKAVEGAVDWGPEVFGYVLGDESRRSTADSAPHAICAPR